MYKSHNEKWVVFVSLNELTLQKPPLGYKCEALS